MKKTILIAFCLVHLSGIAQYLGISSSFHNETRNKKIYGSGLENRKSVTQFLGGGIRAQKKFAKTWELNVGINYVERWYEMIVPYNHCYFLKPGELCLMYLAHVDEYGYKTIEIPLGINKYLTATDKWELYLNVNTVTAYDFQAFYHPYIPKKETIRVNEINLFSNSVISSLGFAYKVSEKIKITIEPFIRLIHTQRADPILFTGYEQKWTYFDNFGVHLLLLHKLK